MLTIHIGPFMATIVTALAITIYMIFIPGHWIRNLMQLTKISPSFRLTLLGLGVAYLVAAWVGEHYIFSGIARGVGVVKTAITKKAKKRKQYKIILEQMKA